MTKKNEKVGRNFCPICKKKIDKRQVNEEVKPFCSTRCKEIDLGNWFGEFYHSGRPLQPKD